MNKPESESQRAPAEPRRALTVEDAREDAELLVTPQPLTFDALASEMRFRSLLERCPDGIYTLDRSGVVLAVNRALVQAGDWNSEADLIGHHFAEFIHPEDLERAEADLQATLQGERVGVSEYRLRTRGGSYLLMETRPSPALENGAIVGLFGMARDVTARKRMEAEREQLARSLQLLLESTYEGICAIDTAGVCTLVNSAATQMLGYSAEEILGQQLHALLHGPGDCDESACVIAHVPGEPARRNPDTPLRRRDGTSFLAQVACAPMMEHGESRGAVVSFTDLTERRALERELERARNLSALGQMAATVAHEFNNVLMAIQPFAEILARQAKDEKSANAVQHIRQSVERGRHVTEEVLRFARRSEPVRRPVQLDDFFDRLGAQLEASMPAGIDVRMEGSGAKIVVDADSEQLTQVFLNLASNARDAMPAGGTLTVQVSVTASDGPAAQARRGQHVHVVVRDSGCGISADAIPRIFQPFFTTKRRGTGLGLPAAQQIVAAHGGELSVESREGVGTAVHVVLPCRVSNIAADLKPRQQADRHVPIGYVLIVEDEEVIAAGVAELLRMEGIECACVATGAGAIAAADERRPDAIILDIGLPDVSGTVVFELLRHRWPDLPVVFATGHGDQGKLSRYLSRPRVGFLRKPYELSALFAWLQTVTEAAPPPPAAALAVDC